MDDDETLEEKPILDEEIDEPVNPIDKVIQKKNKFLIQIFNMKLGKKLFLKIQKVLYQIL